MLGSVISSTGPKCSRPQYTWIARYPLHLVPQFAGSCFEKQKYILQRISEARHSSFRKSILEYLNVTEKGLNEPEAITALLLDKTPQALRELLSHIFDEISANWVRKQPDAGQSLNLGGSEEYELYAIKNMPSEMVGERQMIERKVTTSVYIPQRKELLEDVSASGYFEYADSLLNSTRFSEVLRPMGRQRP